MTNNANIAGEAGNTSSAISRISRQISPRLSATAAGLTAVGIGSGFIEYLHRSPIREEHVPGTSAWAQHLIVAAVACTMYGVARHLHGRRLGRGSGRLLLLAPLGRTAASRLTATMRQVSWRSAAALPPLVVIAYSLWRIGEQVLGGLDPNFTVNAWGGPSYLGAMACHYLDVALIIAVSAWLLDKILLPAPAGTATAPLLFPGLRALGRRQRQLPDGAIRRRHGCGRAGGQANPPAWHRVSRDGRARS